MLGKGPGERLSNEERHRFWHRVAFYNYVQSFPGESARRRPTQEMWQSGSEPFLRTVEELDPHGVLVLGKGLVSRLPDLPASVKVCRVSHPSSGSFRYVDCQPDVRRLLGPART